MASLAEPLRRMRHRAQDQDDNLVGRRESGDIVRTDGLPSGTVRYRRAGEGPVEVGFDSALYWDFPSRTSTDGVELWLRSQRSGWSTTSTAASPPSRWHSASTESPTRSTSARSTRPRCATLSHRSS